MNVDQDKCVQCIDKIIPCLVGLTIEEGCTVMMTILCNALADHDHTEEDACRLFLRGYKAVLMKREMD